MAKVYNLMMLAILFIAGTTAAQAESRYVISDEEVNWDADSFEEGVDFIINNGYLGGGTVDVISGTSKASYISENEFFQLEAVSETDEGYVSYRLKCTSTGEYLVNNSGSVSYSSTASRAWVFVIKDAVTWDEDDIDDDLVDDYTSATVSTPYGNGVIFVDASATSDSEAGDFYYLCTGDEGESPYFSTSDYYTNLLLVYSVEEHLYQLTGAEYLSQMVYEIMGDSEPSDLYNTGDQPGEISEELMEELQAAYDACIELINEDSTDQDACEAAATRLAEALQAAEDGVIMVEAGYYWFGNARTDVNACYDDGSQICWTLNEDWDYPTIGEMVASDMKYVWQIIENEEESGSYYIRNVYTGRYVGVATYIYIYIETTEEAEESFYIYPQDKTHFLIESASLREEPFLEGYNFLHADGNVNGIVLWTSDATASGWTFITCPESEVERVQSLIEQDKLNTELEELIEEALADYEKGFSYSFDGYSDGHLDNDESGDIMGLVTSIDQVSTNSLETTEGSLEALLDSDISSGNFYHSIWSSTAATAADYDCTEVYPYLQFDLGQAVSDIKVKMWSRYNGSSYYTSNLPGNFNVLVSETPDDEDSWVQVSTAETILKWPNYVTGDDGEEEEEDEETVAYADIHFGADYQYVRLEVTNRYGSTSDFKTLTISSACYNMAEIRVFEEWYDESTSLITAVPDEIVTALLEAIETAEAVVEAGTTTQEDVDAFQAAYDLFLEYFPDPDSVTDAISEALTYYENGSEGTTAGYYVEGSLAEFYAALVEVEAQVSDVMTMDEVNSCLEAIETALATLQENLIMPEADTWYFIVSRSSSTPADSYVEATGNGVDENVWVESTDEDLLNRLGVYWKLIDNEDGTYSLLNALYNEYLDTPTEIQSVGMSTQGDTCVFTLRSARAGNYFNLVFDAEEGIYLNADPSGPVVTWDTAEGTDNSCFEFVEAIPDTNWDGAIAWDVATGYNLITLPIGVESDGSCYTAIGLSTSDDGSTYLEFEQVAKRTEIEAGTPFIYVNEDQSTAYFDCTETSVDELVYVSEALTVNGVVGTLAPIDEIAVGYGILYNNTAFVPSEDGDGVDNNSGYVLPSVPTTDETGDLSILVDGTLTSISTAAVSTESAASIVNVYTLSGTLVRTNVKNANATNGLPAGIYIVGKQKVLVK